jgi:peptidoglycan/LPS O-acetylase OafA/YrhL
MTSPTRLSYITGLDGIRALAVMAVLLYHANSPWALGGFLGVETFFVLSGFLITSLLLAQWQTTSRIDLKHFWLRRARRLLPAVWLLLLVLPFLAILWAPDAMSRLQEDIPAALFYITNWVYIVREVPYFEAFGRPPLLQQLWSLAVEEQFYLLWPLLLLLLLRLSKGSRAGLLAALAILIAASTLWMAVLYSPEADPLRIYYGTDTRSGGFLVGAFLAVLYSTNTPRQVLSKRGISETLGWTGLLALIILYNKLNEFQPFLYRGGILMTALASAVLIVGASSPSTWISQVLELPVLRWIGTRSYSIYLWHWPIFMVTRPGADLALPELPLRVGQVALTFLLAELSFRWVETPVRRQGFRASLRLVWETLRSWSLPRRVSLGAGLVSASLLLIWQGAFHETPASPQVLPTVTFTPSPAAVTAQPATTRTPPAASEGRKETSTPARAVDLPDVTLIGDSIMQGASPLFDDVLGENIYVDAERKRKMEDVPALVKLLSREGHLSRIVVIHLGTNRPFEAPVFDEVMQTLLAQGVERVIFINVHRPIGWESYVNRKFTEGIERWPQAELIDWDALAHTRQNWFIDDQTHLSFRGSEAYVGAIKEKLEQQP